MMETSVWLAQLLALLYLSVGFGFMIDKKFYQKMLTEWTKGGESMATYIGGFAALVTGFLIIHTHNVWEGPLWVSLISLLGWLALFKGLVLLIMPSVMMNWVRSMAKNKSFLNAAGYACILLGAYFGYFGFYA
ncbi:hypothetical protein IPJ72_01550 [Candidatus Peregrinibacteria bacterium]|nr:MAG: hypothetical protein IPJ72_01550 [Candidatus Peregrinibacteria bacterium]